MSNVVLIGMPGCGKSTVGVLLAKAMLYRFVDTDLLIQHDQGESLCDILAKQGLTAFKTIENRVLCELSCDRCVIATGGSAVYGQEAMAHLRATGTVVYLKLPLQTIEERINNITTRGIAMEPQSTLKTLYAERAPLYEHYADVTVDCRGLSVEDCVQAVLTTLA